MFASILLTCLTSMTSGYGVIENEASGSILLNQDAPTFKLIADPAPIKTLESEDGYAFADLAVYKSPFTECSDLYLLQAAVSFTPGCVARANGSKQGNGDDFVNSYLNSGYFHLEVNDIDQGWRRSSKIAIKGSWPDSSNVQTTISSSFGVSLNTEFGQSLEGGITLGNGASLKLTSSSSIGTAVTLSFEKSISSVASDPLLSHQINPQNTSEQQWSYSVLNKKVAGKITYTLDSYLLFEMDRSSWNCSNDAFHCEFDSSYTNAKTTDEESKLFPQQTNDVNSIGFFYN